MSWPERHPRVSQAALYLGILAAWEILPRAGLVPRLFVPPLSEALGALVADHREYLGSLPTTFGEILVSYLIGCTRYGSSSEAAIVKGGDLTPSSKPVLDFRLARALMWRGSERHCSSICPASLSNSSQSATLSLLMKTSIDSGGNIPNSGCNRKSFAGSAGSEFNGTM